MSAAGLEVVSGHFAPRRKPWLKDGNMWSMLCWGQEVHSHTNYILGIDHCLIQNVAVQDAHHNTDHYLVLGCFCRAATAVHSH